MAIAAVTEANMAANPARGLIFFRGTLAGIDDTCLCYNYMTNQWTAIPAYDGIGLYSINDRDDIGLVRFSSGSVDLQKQGQFTSGAVSQDAVIQTSAIDPNTHGRAVVQGVRPLTKGGTNTVRVGTQDNLSDAVTYSAVTSPNSRSGQANFRSEGRYMRVELTTTGGFDTIMGADVEFSPQGFV